MEGPAHLLGDGRERQVFRGGKKEKLKKLQKSHFTHNSIKVKKF